MTHHRTAWFRHRMRRHDLGVFELGLTIVTLVWMACTVWGSLQ